MKRVFSLVLACLLLCGCSQKVSVDETRVFSPTEAAPSITEPVGMYAPGHPLEEKYQGALRVYPLDIRKVQGMRAMNNGLLLLSGYGATTLTLLTGDDLFVTASVTLDFELDANDPSLRIHQDTLSCFDPVKRETVVLNEGLKEVSRIAAPEDLAGRPILSADRNTLYYCTSNAIRAWNLETGIRRCVKELSYDQQELTGLHMQDTMLQCRIVDDGKERTLLLSANTGRLLYEVDGALTLETTGSRYYASVPDGAIRSQLFGTQGESPTLLTPADITAQCFYLDQNNALVALSGTDQTTLDYYELGTGLRRSSLTLDGYLFPSSITDTADGSVYFLAYDPAADCDTVYRWDVSAMPVNDGNLYTGPYYTAAEPDTAGLAQCKAYAGEIGEKYGIEVLIWKDTLAAQPWDYDFQPEYLVPVLQRELRLLDQRLAQYPAEILSDTISHFTGLKICLVRQINGAAESGSLHAANGVQFFQDTEAYVAIAVGKYSDHALYHELFHVMETHILNESVAFDQWEELNPSGFSYDYHHSTAQAREAGVYLEGDSRAFVDTYSMSFPKEDRARIMEYAMLEGNADLFDSPIMQAKLAKLCQGIREAYGLKKSPETFPWEQYLRKPLDYTK